MELELNYEVYKRAENKYAVLNSDCKKWKRTHKEACDRIIENENRGNWEKNFANKTTALDSLFLEFSKKMDLMCSTFSEADEYIGKMFAQVQALDPAIVSGTGYAGNQANPTDDQEGLMYDSTLHDRIIDGCLEVTDKTDQEKKVLDEISELIERLKYAGSVIPLFKEDVALMENGLKKQGNITPFADTFQAYVREVDEFNTNISSKFASVVEALPGGDIGTPVEDDKKDDAKDEKKESETSKDDQNSGSKDKSDGTQKVVIEIDRGESGDYSGREGGYAGGYGGGYGAYPGGYADGSYGGYAGGNYAGNGANLTTGNKNLFDFVRGHKGFENYTDNQIMECFSKMGPGSSFEAYANSIFEQYKNDPEGFEKRFGFSLYDENGKFNYYKLAFDEFAKGNAGGLDSTAGTGTGAGAGAGAGTGTDAGSKATGASGSKAKAEKPIVKGLDKNLIV